MADELLPNESAGQVAAEDGATTTRPSTFSINGRVNPSLLDLGLDAPTRTIAQTQSTSDNYAFGIRPGNTNGAVGFNPANTNGFGLNPAAAGSGVVAPTATGIGAGNDDTVVPNRTATQVTVDDAFNANQKIDPQSNVLDQYASYTYTASLYLMSAEAYAAMIKSKRKSISGTQLLIQSGGAPVNGRNPYFTNDYYIDKIEIKSSIMGKGTNAAHNSNGIKMTVVEPAGITFMQNLKKAVDEYIGSSTPAGGKDPNWGSQLYLLVLRFYGYDDNGNLVQAGQPGSAVIEKYLPMTINTLRFKVANKIVEYEIEGSCPSYQINVGQVRGTIPYNVELSGISVADALTGNSLVTNNSTTSNTTPVRSTDTERLNEIARENGVSAEGEDVAPSAPANASAAPNPKLTIRQGLCTALNEWQQQLVKDEIYTYPDVYSIEFASPIDKAQLVRIGQDKKSSPTQMGGTANDQVNPDKQSVDTTTRILTATAGMQMVQFLDQVVRNSTYIQDQQTIVVNESTQKQQPNGGKSDSVAWFKISLEATPTKYDPKRNDYAYNIKYVIHPYKINSVVSPYFNQPVFNGVHKQFYYWFTGQNTQVLNYEQTYNAQYSLVMSGAPANESTNANDSTKMSYQTRSGQSSQGAAGKTNEPASNLADFLYNPSDLSQVNIQVVGDPAWLQQGEASTGVSATGFNYGPFNPDGTINFESQEILFQVLINAPTDYNYLTGVMDPNQPTQDQFNQGVKSGGAQQTYIYHANTVLSMFDKGKFTQTINGTLMPTLTEEANQKNNGSINGRPSKNGGNTAPGTRDANTMTAEEIVADQNAAFEYGTNEGSEQTRALAEQDSDFAADNARPAGPAAPATSTGDITPGNPNLRAPAKVADGETTVVNNTEPQIIARDA